MEFLQSQRSRRPLADMVVVPTASVDRLGAPDRNRQGETDGSAECDAEPASCRVQGQSAPTLPGHIGSRWGGNGSWGETAARATRGRRELTRVEDVSS